MTEILVRASAAAVGAWTYIYTTGLDPDLRDRRRAEVASDLWESRHDGRPPLSLAAHTFARLTFGLFSDLRWRSEHRQASLFEWFTVRFMAATAIATLVVWATLTPGQAYMPLAPKSPDLLGIGSREMPPPPPPPPCPPAWTGLDPTPGCEPWTGPSSAAR